MSSMMLPIFGSVSLISIPFRPQRLNLRGEGMKPEPLVFFPSGCFPSNFSSSGFGSNVSTCDGPPFMKRKITRLARGAKCATGPSPPAAAILGSIPASPTMPKPAHIRCNICRRVGCSIHINRLAANQHHLGKLLPARHSRFLRPLQKVQCHLCFIRPRLAPKNQPIHPLDLRFVFFNPLRPQSRHQRLG